MNNEQKIIKRIEVSKNNSWDIRFSTMLSSIQFHLKKNSNKMVGNNKQKTNY